MSLIALRKPPGLSLRSGLAVLLALAFSAAALQAAVPESGPGALDPSFGAGGLVFQRIGGGQLTDLASALLQPDGKIVVASERQIWLAGAGSELTASEVDTYIPPRRRFHSTFVLSRYQANGQPDASFGGDGTAFTAVGGWGSLTTLSRQPDGKLLVGGSHPTPHFMRQEWLLIRYQDDGTLDRTFGRRGYITGPAGRDGGGVPQDTAVQPDGRILVLIHRRTSLYLARYLPDGRVDRSFARGFPVALPVEPPDYGRSRLLLQPDGRIVAAGMVSAGDWNQSWGIVRYLPDGTLDPGFGRQGLVTTPMGPADNHQDRAYALALQADGRLIVGGSTLRQDFEGYTQDMAIARYTPRGELDPSFGEAGRVIQDFGDNPDEIFALAVQPDGKVVALGHSALMRLGQIVVLRYLPDGSLDPNFGAAGLAAPGLYDQYSPVGALMLQGDGNLVLAGTAGPDPRELSTAFVARIQDN